MNLNISLLMTALVVISATLATGQSCPPLQLDWGNYTGTISSGNVCIYSNVRFASPPVGQLRFAAPKYPPSSSDPKVPQDALIGCIAMKENKCLTPSGSLDGRTCYPSDASQIQEDCLLLDMYVPLTAFDKGASPLPVVVWIYGGAYAFGSKSQFNFNQIPFYDGDGLIAQSVQHNGSMIFIAGYRLGAFGWLAGSYMEKIAQPNAGLLDQRAVLQFVQDNISKVNGNPKNVNVWGESAGASSIMHHLVMPKPALFNKAILQSPAYQWLWDRNAGLNTTFTYFAGNVSATDGCKSADIECLRNASSATLTKVNNLIFQEQACRGIWPVGPSVDGKLIPELAPVLVSTGKVAKIDSIIVSHVDNEVPLPLSIDDTSFIPLPIRQHPFKSNYFDDFINEFMPGTEYELIRQSIKKKYPYSILKPDQVIRARRLIEDASFLCHTRFLIDAYHSLGKPAYAMDYAGLEYWLDVPVNKAVHASDLLPTFVNGKTNYTDLFTCLIPKPFKGQATAVNNYLTQRVAPAMQTWFTNHAIHGNPSYNINPNDPSFWANSGTKNCESSSQNKCISSMMKVVTPFYSSTGPITENSAVDEQTNSDTCDFWLNAAKQITSASKASTTNSYSDDYETTIDEL